jgi:flap endonuclease-1
MGYMGVQIGSIIPSKEIDLTFLSGKRIAVDAFNFLHQFLSIIRDKITGEPLRDSKGRITSHLSGLFYRNINLIEAGIKTVWVFDGKPPEFKKEEIEERKEVKELAIKKWEEALEKGEKAKKYAQATSVITEEIVEDAKKLLDLMGIPYVQAPSEGEMQAAYMCKKGDVWATASQDYDSLLAGSTRLVRNVSVTQKRKLPNKEIYVEVNPELIELEEVISKLGITQEQLILIGILVGTDYNPGVKGFGPKKALAFVKEHKTAKKVFEKIEWSYSVSPEEILNFFMNPPVTDDYKIEWKEPKTTKLIDFLVKEHDFSEERVSKFASKLEESFKKGRQASLEGWLKK